MFKFCFYIILKYIIINKKDRDGVVVIIFIIVLREVSYFG